MCEPYAAPGSITSVDYVLQRKTMVLQDLPDSADITLAFCRFPIYVRTVAWTPQSHPYPSHVCSWIAVLKQEL